MAVTQFGEDEVISRGSVNRRITEINETFPLPVSKGGTGATSLVSGNILLGNGTGIISGTSCLPVSKGGTGATSLTSGNILLGNGTGTISGTSCLPVSKGGTGGTTVTDARNNLGVFTTYILYDTSHTGDQPTNGNIDFRLPTGVTHLHDFKYLEFYFSNKADSGVYDDGIAVSKVYRTLSGTRFNNTINLSFAGASHSGSNTYFNLYNTRYNIETSTSSSTLSKAIKAASNSYYISFGETGCSRHAVDSDNDIYVWRVVGYKL